MPDAKATVLKRIWFISKIVLLYSKSNLPNGCFSRRNWILSKDIWNKDLLWGYPQNINTIPKKIILKCVRCKNTLPWYAFIKVSSIISIECESCGCCNKRKVGSGYYTEFFIVLLAMNSLILFAPLSFGYKVLFSILFLIAFILLDSQSIVLLEDRN